MLVFRQTDLDAQQQTVVDLLQLLLPHLNVLGSVLLLLKLPDVVDRGLQDGAFVQAHLAANAETQENGERETANREYQNVCLRQKKDKIPFI